MKVRSQRRHSNRTREYWLRRLGRDRPDLLARVEADELSVHAATLEAGWRKRGKAGPRTQPEPPPAGYAYEVHVGRVDAYPLSATGPEMRRIPIVGRTIQGWPITGVESLIDPNHRDWWRIELALEPLRPQSDGFGYYNEYGCGPIEWTDQIPEAEEHCSDGEVGRRLRRELGCDGYDRILLDEAEARALLAEYARRWDEAAPARERFLSERRAAAEIWNRELERLQQQGQRRQEHERREEQARLYQQYAEASRGFPISLEFQSKADASLLGLSWPCTEDELKSTHRRLAREWHPDCQLGEETTPIMARLNSAYDRLLAAIQSEEVA